MTRVIPQAKAMIAPLVFLSVLIGSSLAMATKAEAQMCVRHYYNKSDAYWYVRIFNDVYSRGDYDYMTIPPHTTFSVSYYAGDGPGGGGMNDNGWFTETSPGHYDVFVGNLRKSIRIQRYEGPNKSGKPTYNSKFRVEEKSPFGSSDTCIYFHHSGSTGLGTLNDPADGDLYLH